MTCEERLDAAYKRGVSLGGLFGDTPIGREFAEAYEAWMQERAGQGDRFALSLGYGPKRGSPPA